MFVSFVSPKAVLLCQYFNCFPLSISKSLELIVKEIEIFD